MNPTADRIAFVGLCAVLLLMCVLRAPSLVTPIWSSDDGTLAVIANKILDGGIPYRDAVDHRAPLPWYACALTFLLFGSNNLNALKIVLAGLCGIIIVLIFLIGRLTVGNKGSLFAALLFAICSSIGLDRIGYSFQPEWCLAVFTCLGSYLFLRGVLFGHLGTYSFFSGLSYGLAVFSKQPAIVDFLAPLLFLFIQKFTKNDLTGLKTSHSILKSALFLVLGFSLVCVLFLGYFSVTGAWDDFVFYFWTYNIESFLPARTLWKRILMVPMWVVQVSAPLNLGVWALAGLLIVFLNCRLHSAPNDSCHRGVLQYLVIWSITSFLATQIGGRNYSHYAIQLLPSWCLLSGLAFHTFLDFVDTLKSGLDRRLRRLVSGVLVTFLVLLLVIPTSSLIVDTSKFVREVLRSQPTGMIEWITSHSRKNDTIFVWGFCPHLYTLADRTPASRYPYYHFQSGFICWVREKNSVVPGTMEILLKELELNRPRIIVDQFSGITESSYWEMPISDFPQLWKFVNENYVFKEQFKEGGVWLLRGEPRHY